MSERHDLRRDVGQLIWIGFRGTAVPDYVRRGIAVGRIGGVVLFKRNLETSREVVTYAAGTAGAAPDAGGNESLVSQAMRGELLGPGPIPEAAVTREVIDLDALIRMNSQLHDAVAAGQPPLFISVDQEGGHVQRVRAPATLWPPMLQFDRFEDAEAEELAAQVGEAMGRELAALGFDIDFAPVLDVHTNPDNPVIGDRAFSNAPDRVAVRALAFARGLDAAGIVSCGKHFPGHGDTHTDSHLELPRLDHDLDRLRAVELVPFRRAAAAGVPMIMTAHVVFAAIDDRVPATLSRKVMHDLLRVELGYKGLVVSDDLDMNAISKHFGAGVAAVDAVRAGCDALLLCCDNEAQKQAYESLVRVGEADSAVRRRIGEAAASVRKLKRTYAARTRTPLDVTQLREVVGSEAHRRLAERLAAP